MELLIMDGNNTYKTLFNKNGLSRNAVAAYLKENQPYSNIAPTSIKHVFQKSIPTNIKKE